MTTRALSFAVLLPALAIGCADAGLAVEGSVQAVAGDAETRFDFPGRISLLAPDEPGADEVFSGVCRQSGDGAWEFSVIRPGDAPADLGLARFVVETSDGASSVRATLGTTLYSSTAACEVLAEESDDDDDIDEDEEDEEDEFDDSMRVRVECTVADSEGNEAQVSSDLVFTGCAE